MMAVERNPLRWLVGAWCLAGLSLLGGCAGASNIGLPMAETISAGQEAAAPGEVAAAKPVALTGPEAQAYAAPGAGAAPVLVAEGDADDPAEVASAAPANAPWTSLDRWSADGQSRLLTTEEVNATQQTLRERAAAQLRQTLEVMSLRRQRAAAAEVVANAVQRTQDVLSGINSKCRTGQADEACTEASAAAPAPSPAQ